MKANIMYFGGIIGFMAIIVFLWIKIWNTGTSADSYNKICIEGHTYHVANFMAKVSTAIKLDDEGKPVKCKE